MTLTEPSARRPVAINAPAEGIVSSALSGAHGVDPAGNQAFSLDETSNLVGAFEDENDTRRVGEGDGFAVLRPIDLHLVTSLPLRLDVKIPLPNFRFKDLAHLRRDQVLLSEWPVSEDLPVAAGDVRLLWAEFSVADQQLTVRVTRVA